MRTSSRTLLPLVLLLSVLVAVTAASEPALAAHRHKQVLARDSGDVSTCTYDTARHLAAVEVAGPLVHEQRKWARRKERQYIRYTPALQGLTSGGRWVNVPGKAMQKVIRLNTWNARSWRQLRTVTITVPAGFEASAYRVTATIRWYGTSQKPAAKRTLLLTRYSGGSSSCLASRPAPGAQALAVSASTGVAATGQAFSAAFTATGVSGPETVTKTLYGPQASPAGCTGAVAQQSTTTIDKDGTYPIEAAAGSVSGYYYWGVSAAGNGSASPAAACSAAVTVRKSVSLNISLGNRYLSKGALTAGISISGFDRQTASSWNAVLWGPYDTIAAANAANCTGATLHDTYSKSGPIGLNQAAGTVYGTTVSKTKSQVAYWRWQLIYYGNALSEPARLCAPVFHTLQNP